MRRIRERKERDREICAWLATRSDEISVGEVSNSSSNGEDCKPPAIDNAAGQRNEGDTNSLDDQLLSYGQAREFANLLCKGDESLRL